MKTYCVSIPIAGAIHIEVEAASSEEAKEKAWEKINKDSEKAGEVEWEFFDHITEGNVCSAPLNDIEVNCFDREGK